MLIEDSTAPCPQTMTLVEPVMQPPRPVSAATEADDALTEGEYLRVIGALNAPPRSCRGGGADPRHFVRRDRHAKTGSADQERAVGACGDQFGGLDGDPRVGGVLVGGGRRRRRTLLMGSSSGRASVLFIFESGVVTTDYDSQLCSAVQTSF